MSLSRIPFQSVNESKIDAMSKDESDAFMGEYFAFTDGIRQSGQYVAGEALQPVATATTVRVRNGDGGITTASRLTGRSR